MSAHEIEWIERPDRPLVLRRIAYTDCPRFIRKAFGPRRDLFELGDPLIWIWLDRWRCELKPGAISDLTSVPLVIPRWIASRSTRTNHLDIGSKAHDMGHLGVVEFPGIPRGRRQNQYFDRMMLALWKAEWEPSPRAGTMRRWWQSGKPTRKYVGVRLAAPILWRPDYDNLRPDWMIITDLQPQPPKESAP